jgi:hypothetical protein
VPFNGGTLVTVEGFFDPATGKAEWTFAGPDGLDDPFAPTLWGGKTSSVSGTLTG